MSKLLTGGCQCGAVRFTLKGQPGKASICHCRMCQKAFGSYFAPLISVGEGSLEWTRGTPAHFQSSNVVKRGFCRDCGTPLTYEAPDGVAIAAGTFDDPEALPPVIQYGTERKLSFFDELHALPGRSTSSDIEDTAWLVNLSSFQHPDHDTDRWSS
ncbi:GFA family protein [Limoniibacter endophyticus]|uniref:Aldehyde-activating protein n=1 Tax=Limoniibacter endophyticus TaxID=1565040 RepID=A0A8J3DI04_9HYPH|nr:GFA family protein [Limoniibacter endophyticus]GHC68932.1 aldehyde-activating protein [Limoniibacter endophyticus]